MSQIKVLLSLFITFSLVITTSCSEDDESTEILDDQNEKGTKIMPLGASRVEGARPAFESFRYELWKLLTADSLAFNYVGTQRDDASYPTFNGLSFDDDHEGRGGWTSGEILQGIESWIEAGNPDIVLFSSPAGNDALQNLSYSEAISNINAIIDIIQAANPNVTIIIEQLAPGQSEIMTGDLLVYFENMQNDVLTIASNQTTSTSSVIAVDMFTGFSDAMLADDVHYNEAGAKFIAERYFSVLVPILRD